MKKILPLIIMLSAFRFAHAQKIDSCYAGVYITKEDFINHSVSYITNIGAKGNRLNFTFPAGNMVLKIVTHDNATLKYRPGEIYGYTECGYIFRYSKGGELYAPEDYYRVEESGELVIYSSRFKRGNEYFYSVSSTSTIHRLSMKNLTHDFGKYTAFMTDVNKLKNNSTEGLSKRDQAGLFLLNKIYIDTIKKSFK